MEKLKVKQIIKELKKYPKDKEVQFGMNMEEVYTFDKAPYIDIDTLEFKSIEMVDNKVTFILHDNFKIEPRVGGRR